MVGNGVGSVANFRVEARMKCAAVSVSGGVFETEDVCCLSLESFAGTGQELVRPLTCYMFLRWKGPVSAH